MALRVTTQKFDAAKQTKGSPSRLKVSSPKQSPGREVFGNGSKSQNCGTVRAELRKTPGRGKRF